MASDNPEKLGIQSAEVAAEILRALAKLDRPAPLREIAYCAGMHPAKAHRYLVSLVRSELASQDSFTGLYGLGSLAVRIGLAALRQSDIVRVASTHIQQAQKDTAQTMLLTVWGGTAPTIVHRAEEPGSPVYRNAAIGSSLPLFASASGLIFAAFMPEKLIQPLLRDEVLRIRNKGNGQSFNDVTVQTLHDVRQHGFSYICGNYVAGTSSLAAPVYDSQGQIAAALAIVGRTAEIDISQDGKNVKDLLNCVRKISCALGFSEEQPNLSRD